MIIIDAHQDQKVIGNFPKDLLDNLKKQTSLSLLKKSGINLFFYSIYADSKEKNVNKKIKEAILKAKKEFKKYKIVLVKNKSDIQKIKNGSKQPFVILHIEGLNGIREETDIKYLREWFFLGVRSFGLVWSEGNLLGGGSNENSNRGLTELGKKVVNFLENKKAIIDFSHTNYKTFFDIAKISKKPIIVTHGNAFDICRTGRNFKKDQIIEISKRRGFLGVVFSSKLVSKRKDVGVKDLIAHINYFKKNAGLNFVGIGSDLGGIRSRVVKGVENVCCLNNFFVALKQEGYNQKEIECIAGKNILRVLERILPEG